MTGEIPGAGAETGYRLLLRGLRRPARDIVLDRDVRRG
jgi:hypothetical protein